MAQERDEVVDRASRVDVVAGDADEVGPTDDRVGPGADAADGLARHELAEQPLPADRHERVVRRRPSAHSSGSSPATGASSQPRLARQSSGTASTGSGSDGLAGDLEAALGPLDVHEDRARRERHEPNVDAGLPQQVELGRRGRLRVDADDRPASAARAGPRSARCTRRRRRAASRADLSVDVAARRPDDEDGGTLRAAVGHRRPGRSPESRPYTWRPSIPFPDGAGVYFYELHEGDEEIFSDVLLVHETEMDPGVLRSNG